MEKMVAGLLFSEAFRYVTLIEKNRPSWQAGLLNGVGGHIEGKETPVEAMQREFLEETGLNISSWYPLVEMHADTWMVTFFAAVGNVSTVASVTDERVGNFLVDSLPSNVIPNLRWLIPLALDNSNGLLKPVQVHYGQEGTCQKSRM
jgi:8-oxo-dGTP diphosphatase